MSDTKLILKVNDVADYAATHPDTIRRALEAGELHGMQKRVGAHWRIRVSCVDAWMNGTPCEHQSKAA